MLVLRGINHKKGVRDVTNEISMKIQQKYLRIVREKEKICFKCRISLYEKQSTAEIEEENRADELRHDLDYTEDCEPVFESLESSLEAANVSPIKQKHLKSQKLRKRKFHEIVDHAASIFQQKGAKPDERLTFYDEMIKNIKLNVKNPKLNIQEKCRIMSIVPKCWSIRKISKELTVTKYHAAEVKKVIFK